MMSRLVLAGFLVAGMAVAATPPAAAAPGGVCIPLGLDILCSLNPRAGMIVKTARTSAVPMPQSDKATAEIWQSSDLNGQCKKAQPRQGMSLVRTQEVRDGSQLIVPDDQCWDVYIKSCNGLNPVCSLSFQVETVAR